MHVNVVNLERELNMMALAHEMSELKVGPNNKEAKQIFWDIVQLHNSLRDTIAINRLYFSQRFLRSFDALLNQLFKNFISNSVKRNFKEVDDETPYEFYDSGKSLSFYNNEFPVLRKKLELEFRKYL